MGLAFTSAEIEEIDQLWRSLPQEHMWAGWAATGEAPDTIWLFRTRAHWRKFPLTKQKTGFALADETGRRVARARTLAELLRAVEGVPALGHDDAFKTPPDRSPS